MTQRSVAHDTFVIERTYNVPPATVFAAFSSASAKSRWFGPEDENTPAKLEMDFRVGGHETNEGGPPGGPVYKYQATYQDIVQDHRIVATYNMWMDGQLISVSVNTVELKANGSTTKLTYHESGFFLDGLDKPSDRKHGTVELFKALDGYLERAQGVIT
jgi:uncharacterized protein YndB with AHSA1/START domain